MVYQKIAVEVNVKDEIDNAPIFNQSASENGMLTIEVAENHRVQFNFVDFDVEPHANCSYDYVALYDGTSENDPKIIQHCGQNLPTPTATFYATGNKMFIRMKVKNFQFSILLGP